MKPLPLFPLPSRMHPTARLAALAVSAALAFALAGDAFGQSPGTTIDSQGNPVMPPWSPPGDRPLPHRTVEPPRLVFFPPTTPGFGRPIPETASRQTFNGRLFAAPDELADDVNEFFYPALGTRLAEKKLNDQLTARLAAYHKARTALVNELLNELTLAPAADPTAREQALRDFARTQTLRILALETDAERLREDFIHGGLLGYNADWNQNREWRLGDVLPTFGPFPSTAEFQVIRATAHYQKGLLPEQRGLLREIALEQQESLRAARTRLPQAAKDPLEIFFSPETTRLRLPAGLPPALTVKIGTYDGDKAALKRELRELVVAQDKSSEARRRQAFEDLAERQRPRLIVLAELAEEIRRGLAALPEPPPPPLSPQLPPDLAARIEAYKRDRTALLKERFERSGRIRSLDTEPLRVRLENGEAPESRLDQLRAIAASRIEAQRKSDEEFMRENAARYEALVQDLKSIKADLTAFAHAQIDPATGQPMDVATLIRRVSATDQHYEKLGREEVIYKDYRTAMLEPGLSPAQRRLLFGAALVGLAQPLPPGEPMPSGNTPGMSL